MLMPRTGPQTYHFVSAQSCRTSIQTAGNRPHEQQQQQPRGIIQDRNRRPSRGESAPGVLWAVECKPQYEAADETARRLHQPADLVVVRERHVRHRGDRYAQKAAGQQAPVQGNEACCPAPGKPSAHSNAAVTLACMKEMRRHSKGPVRHMKSLLRCATLQLKSLSRLERVTAAVGLITPTCSKGWSCTTTACRRRQAECACLLAGTSCGRLATRQGHRSVPSSDCVMKPCAARLLVATAMAALPQRHRLRGIFETSVDMLPTRQAGPVACAARGPDLEHETGRFPAGTHLT